MNLRRSLSPVIKFRLIFYIRQCRIGVYPGIRKIRQFRQTRRAVECKEGSSDVYIFVYLRLLQERKHTKGCVAGDNKLWLQCISKCGAAWQMLSEPQAKSFYAHTVYHLLSFKILLIQKLT